MNDYLPVAAFMVPTLVVFAAAVLSFGYSTDLGEPKVSAAPPVTVHNRPSG